MKQKPQSPKKIENEPFRLFLLENTDLFHHLTEPQQNYMAGMIANIAEEKTENKMFENTFCAFFRSRYAVFFDNSNFQSKNALLGSWLIKVHEGHFIGSPLGIADGWTISNDAWGLYQKFVTDLDYSKLLPNKNFKGEAKPRYSNGIRGFDLAKHPSIFKGISVPYKTPIDVDSVSLLRLKHLNSRSQNKKSLQIISDCCFILTSVFMEDGQAFLYHQHIQYPTGRLYIQGKSLQTVCKEVKAAALTGYYDYDFENCHYEIVRQLGNKYGFPTEHLTYYCDHKSEFRKQVAEQNFVDIPTAKVVLLSLIYGARLTKSRSRAIYKSLLQGSDMDVEQVELVIDNMKQDTILQGLIKELKEVRNFLFKNHKTNSFGQYFNKGVFNIVGLKTECGKNPDNISMAHIIQGYEVWILKAVLEECGVNLVLLQHDGFVSNKPLDIPKLENAVFEKTGFRMKITGEKF